jgi:hypothetical protein
MLAMARQYFFDLDELAKALDLDIPEGKSAYMVPADRIHDYWKILSPLFKPAAVAAVPSLQSNTQTLLGVRGDFWTPGSDVQLDIEGVSWWPTGMYPLYHVHADMVGGFFGLFFVSREATPYEEWLPVSLHAQGGGEEATAWLPSWTVYGEP